MEFSRRTAQMLHEDHRSTLEMIDGLEGLIAKAGRNKPDLNNPGTSQALEQAAAVIEQEIREHFAFEENELFTRLAEMGDEDIGNHLREEHQAMLPLGEQVSQIAKQALAEGFDDASWQQFKSLAAELTERMLSHIQKEEMALLPLLDDILDAQTDFELSESYGSSH